MGRDEALALPPILPSLPSLISSQGQLGAGVGKRADAHSPQPVPFLRGKRLAGVACGDAHTLVVTGTPCLLLPPTPTPTRSLNPPQRSTRVTEPAVEPRGSNATSTVLAFGANDSAQLGLGQDLLDRAVPCKVPLLSGSLGRGVYVASVAAGAAHSAAVTSALFCAAWLLPHARTPLTYTLLSVSDCGDLYTWGSSMHGQSGHGHEVLQTYPRRVKALLQQDRRVHGVALGGAHTLVFGSVEGAPRASLPSTILTTHEQCACPQSDHAALYGLQAPGRRRRRRRRRRRCQAPSSARSTTSSCAPTLFPRVAPSVWAWTSSSRRRGGSGAACARPALITACGAPLRTLPPSPPTPLVSLAAVRSGETLEVRPLPSGSWTCQCGTSGLCDCAPPLSEASSEVTGSSDDSSIG